jgi:hypothetical protein
MFRTRRTARFAAVVTAAALGLGLTGGAAHAFWTPPELTVNPCDLNPDLPGCQPDEPEGPGPLVDICEIAPELCDFTTPTTDPNPPTTTTTVPTPDPEPEPEPEVEVVPAATPTVVVADPHFTG